MPRETLACTGNYTVTQGDVDRGSVTNTATATGYFHDTPTSGSDTKIAPATQTPAIALAKQIVSGSPFSAAGQVIGYSLIAS
ncbi:MAG: hypothetical protein WCL50_11535, partial [Spirochaetota bacterium]